MSDIEYSTDSYCAICDLYFPTVKYRAEHIADSPAHPRCGTCDRRFLNGNILRNHYVYSRYHYYCASCRVSFDTAAGLRMHIEHSAIHGDDSDDEDEDDDDDGPSSVKFVEGQEDILGELMYPDAASDDERDGDSDDDDSWEHFDECDFEDEEDLGDVVPYDNAKVIEEEDEEEEDTDGASADKFACPVCDHRPNAVCTTSCGHFFCGPCIRMAYDVQGTCPVCDEVGSVGQLRKFYIST